MNSDSDTALRSGRSENRKKDSGNLNQKEEPAEKYRTPSLPAEKQKQSLRTEEKTVFQPTQNKLEESAEKIETWGLRTIRSEMAS